MLMLHICASMRHVSTGSFIAGINSDPVSVACKGGTNAYTVPVYINFPHLRKVQVTNTREFKCSHMSYGVAHLTSYKHKYYVPNNRV